MKTRLAAVAVPDNLAAIIDHYIDRLGSEPRSLLAAAAVVAASELAIHFDRGRRPMAALRYYAEAAEAALLHFSPAACMSRAERGLALVPQAPEGAERDALELTLATLHGMSAFHSRWRVRAAALRQPMTRLVAVWHETLLEVRVGGTERVATLVDEMQALVDESSVAHGQTACQ